MARSNLVCAHAGAIPLKDNSVQCVVTSPPFWRARDYHTSPQLWADGWVGELGLELLVAQYINHLAEVFREVRRGLRPDGTVWIHMEDGYAGGGVGHRDPKRWPKQAGNAHYPRGGRKTDPTLKPKSLILLPARLWQAMIEDGWNFLGEVVVAKRNPMPQTVKDRPPSAHGFVLPFAKSVPHFYNTAEVPSEYRSSVWEVTNRPNPKFHFAIMPEQLAAACIVSGSIQGDLVFDPFAGTGTTMRVAQQLGRRSIGLELQPEFIEIAKQRSA